MLVTPAMATVAIEYGVNASGEVVVTYDANTETELVRAFALDIELSAGTITSAPLASFDANYPIYPGSIVIVSGVVTNDGSPIGNPAVYPGVTLGGVGTVGMTTEMGSLYASGETPPPNSGTLFEFVISVPGATITMSENSARGGVVMEDPQVDPVVTFTEVCGTCMGDFDRDGTRELFEDLLAQLTNHTNYEVANPGSYDVPSTDPLYELCCDNDVDGKMELFDDLLATLTIFTNYEILHPGVYDHPCP
jgi:hypothetical protein